MDKEKPECSNGGGVNGIELHDSQNREQALHNDITMNQGGIRIEGSQKWTGDSMTMTDNILLEEIDWTVTKGYEIVNDRRKGPTYITTRGESYINITMAKNAQIGN